MKKSSVRSRVAWSVAGALALVACSSDPAGSVADGLISSDGHSAIDRVRFPSSASSEAAFAFFIATSEYGSYRVSAVNGAPFTCGSQESATSCRVSSIDLSVLNLDPDVATKLLRGVSRDATSPTLLFAGAVSGDTLSVEEVWKAPSAVALDGTLFHVSHDPQQALVVNAWTPSSIGTPDFSQTQETLDCNDSDGGAPCALSYLPVETDLASSAGVLLVGETESDRGARSLFRVRQYFMEVTVGQTQDGDGYSYCQAGEHVCPSGVCSVSGNCLHWGGRGLAKIYDRSGVETFDDWLVATGQLHADENPNAQ
jgi:hypothetical protein